MKIRNILGAAFICIFSGLVASEEMKPAGMVAKAPKLFGYDFFEKSLMPKVGGEETIGPITANYLINPDDEIVVDVWGELNFSYVLKVSLDGFVDIPVAGRVYLNGLTFAEMKNRVIGQLSRVYSSQINPKSPGTGKAIVEITLGKVRGVNVMTAGEVTDPGPYIIHGTMASLFTVLSMSGGVKQTGSLRQIKVIKADGRELEVDFYKFLSGISVEKSAIQLQSGDTVFVPLKGKEVTINGEVKRPGVYEIKADENTDDLINLAGGFTPRSYTKIVHTVRLEKDGGKKHIDLPYEKAKEFALLEGDVVSVSKMPEEKRSNFVTVSGEGIRAPGVYEFKEGMTIKVLIQNAGGIQEDAYLEKADLLKFEENPEKIRGGSFIKICHFNLGKLLEGDEKENLILKVGDEIVIHIDASIKSISTVKVIGEVKFPAAYTLVKEEERLSDIIERAGGLLPTAFWEGAELKRSFGDIGKVIINLKKALGNRGSSFDIILFDGDTIFVPQKSYVVTVRGEVWTPGSIQYEGGNANYYIKITGGLKDTADRGKIRIFYPDGSVKKVRKLWADPTIRPGCIIEVPKKVETKKSDTIEVPKKAETKKSD